jgi:glycosyltransferase involved in cell wall biosynthesis
MASVVSINYMENKLQVSVIVIAKNAERCISRCLESVYRWAREIVVVINDCNDHTAAIAASFGAKVIDHPWQGFKEQRNFAKQQATMPWVLSIDADEIISEELKQSLINFIAKDDANYNGASCPRLTYFLGKSVTHGGLFPDISIRLFRKNKGNWEGRRIHERLHVDGKIFLLEGNLLHYSYGSLREQIERLLVYSEFFVSDHRGQEISGFVIFLQTFSCFFKRYILKLGFLDGFRGLYLAIAASFFRLYEFTRLYENNRLEAFSGKNPEDAELDAILKKS